MNELYKGMGNAERAKYGKSDFIRMKKDYEAGVISRDVYTSFYVDYLMNLIKKCINEKSYVTQNSPNYEDLIQECLEVIQLHIDVYDPEISEPSTYFKQRFEERIKEYIKAPGVSSYFNTTILKLNKEAKSRGYKDMNDPRLTPQALSVFSGLPLSTIIHARELSNCTTESLDTYNDNVADVRRATPEDMYINKEESSMLWDALQNCTPLERFLIEEFVIEGASLRSLLKFLKEPSNLRRFKGEVTPKMDQIYLQRNLNSGLRNMRNNLSDSKPKKKSKRATIIFHDVEVDSQGTVEDILNGLLE